MSKFSQLEKSTILTILVYFNSIPQAFAVPGNFTMAKLRALLFFPFLLCGFCLSSPALAESMDKVLCSGTQGPEKKLGSGNIYDGISIIKLSLKQAEMETSLGPHSLRVTVQDERNHFRTAFSGNPQALRQNGLTISQDDISFNCKNDPSKLIDPVLRPDGKLKCYIDELEFKGGALIKTERMLSTQTLFPGLGREIVLKASNELYQYNFYLDPIDPLTGLRVQIQFKQFNYDTKIIAPTQTFQASLLMALTHGSMQSDATMLRLGCEIEPSPR